MKRKVLALMVCLALVVTVFVFPTVASADGTTQVTITKYTNGIPGTPVTKTYSELEAQKPVLGDGTTHYYHEKFTTGTWSDQGAVQGTLLKDVCDLAGGACPGDTIELVGIDGFKFVFTYYDIYDQTQNPNNTTDKVCPVVLCWEKDGVYSGPLWVDGMKTVVFDLDDQHFSKVDMGLCMDPSNAAQVLAPTGFAVKYVDEINIYHTGDPCPPIPETSTFVLIGAGLLSLVGFIWVARRRKAAQSNA